MALLMVSLIRRHMKQADSFTVCQERQSLPFVLDMGDERVVGWYDNPEPWLSTLPAAYYLGHPADGIGTMVVIGRWRRLS